MFLPKCLVVSLSPLRTIHPSGLVCIRSLLRLGNASYFLSKAKTCRSGNNSKKSCPDFEVQVFLCSHLCRWLESSLALVLHGQHKTPPDKQHCWEPGLARFNRTCCHLHVPSTDSAVSIKLRVLFNVGVLVTRALTFGVYIGTPKFLETPTLGNQTWSLFSPMRRLHQGSGTAHDCLVAALLS